MKKIFKFVVLTETIISISLPINRFVCILVWLFSVISNYWFPSAIWALNSISFSLKRESHFHINTDSNCADSNWRLLSGIYRMRMRFYKCRHWNAIIMTVMELSNLDLLNKDCDCSWDYHAHFVTQTAMEIISKYCLGDCYSVN